jgi:hypothetical protein
VWTKKTLSGALAKLNTTTSSVTNNSRGTLQHKQKQCNENSEGHSHVPIKRGCVGRLAIFFIRLSPCLHLHNNYRHHQRNSLKPAKTPVTNAFPSLPFLPFPETHIPPNLPTTNMNYAPIQGTGDASGFAEGSSGTNPDRCTRCIQRLDCNLAGPWCIEAMLGCLGSLWGCLGDMCSNGCDCCGDCCGECCKALT